MPDEKDGGKHADERDEDEEPTQDADELEDDLAVGAWVRDHLDPELDATVGKATEAGGAEPRENGAAKPQDPHDATPYNPLYDFTSGVVSPLFAPPQRGGAATPDKKPIPKSPDGRAPRRRQPRGM